MATPAHCIYAFEALASHLEKRKSMTLSEVQTSYSHFIQATDATAAKKQPALRRVADASASSGSGASSVSTTPSSTSLEQPSASSETPNTSASSLATTPPAESPLFVTWNIDSARYGYTLRGCIGTFEPLELDEGIASYALTAALQDHRFSPITRTELPALQVGVTLLTDFEDAAGPMDWELGTHGLRISFQHHGRRYGSTYLPDVAPEQGWTKEETIVSLMRKAGWTGRKDSWQDVELKVVRYQGHVEKLEYDDFKAWRDWADKN